jgi:hypothetical protein
MNSGESNIQTCVAAAVSIAPSLVLRKT